MAERSILDNQTEDGEEGEKDEPRPSLCIRWSIIWSIISGQREPRLTDPTDKTPRSGLQKTTVA
jgi:hypothetical protein